MVTLAGAGVWVGLLSKQTLKCLAFLPRLLKIGIPDVGVGPETAIEQGRQNHMI